MKWTFLTKTEKMLNSAQSKCVWHIWFAWHPVIIENNGRRSRVWMERVGRRCQLFDGNVDYSARPMVGRPEYCSADDALFEMLKDPELNDKRVTTKDMLE